VILAGVPSLLVVQAQVLRLIVIVQIVPVPQVSHYPLIVPRQGQAIVVQALNQKVAQALNQKVVRAHPQALIWIMSMYAGMLYLTRKEHMLMMGYITEHAPTGVQMACGSFISSRVLSGQLAK
jgi:hypothetical protein